MATGDKAHIGQRSILSWGVQWLAGLITSLNKTPTSTLGALVALPPSGHPQHACWPPRTFQEHMSVLHQVPLHPSRVSLVEIALRSPSTQEHPHDAGSPTEVGAPDHCFCCLLSPSALQRVETGSQGRVPFGQWRVAGLLTRWG